MIATKRFGRFVLLFLCVVTFMGRQSVNAQDTILSLPMLETQLRAINLPLIEIWTVDSIEPTAVVVQAPEGMWGTTIRDNEYVYGRMRISTQGMVVYDSGGHGMRIRLRGNSSGAGVKKPYKIKLTQKEDLLFRGDDRYKDKDWVLQRLYDSFPIKVFMGLKVGELVGLEWEPKWEYVNVVVNGKYKGDYLLMESVERESHKLDIDRSGYLIEDDAYWWNEDVYFKSDMLCTQVGYTFKYPDTEDLNDSIVSNIRDFISDFEDALEVQGDISQYIDIVNWAAWLLAQDILGQNDSGGTNRYLYKKDFDPQHPHQTLLKMGPLWDFDASLNVIDTWAAIHDRHYSFYYSKLLQREDFCAHYAALWEKIRKTLYDDVVDYLHDIDASKGKEIDSSRQLNNLLYPGDEATPLHHEISNVEQWLTERIRWIDSHYPKTSDIETRGHESAPSTMYDIYGRRFNLHPHLAPGIYIIEGKKRCVR